MLTIENFAVFLTFGQQRNGGRHKIIMLQSNCIIRSIITRYKHLAHAATLEAIQNDIIGLMLMTFSHKSKLYHVVNRVLANYNVST